MPSRFVISRIELTQQMQAQIGVGGVLDRLVEFGDGEHRNATHPAGIGALMGDACNNDGGKRSSAACTGRIMNGSQI